MDVRRLGGLRGWFVSAFVPDSSGCLKFSTWVVQTKVQYRSGVLGHFRSTCNFCCPGVAVISGHSRIELRQ